MNKVILIGRLCADPEFRQTTSGIAVCRIRIAVNRPKTKDQEQQADFVNCTAWRSTAEFIARYFSKGDMILIEGELRNNNYEDQNGVKHYGMRVLVDSVSFCGSKGDNQQQSVPQTQQPAQAPQATPQRSAVQPQPVQPPLGDLSEFEEILSDGEVPF